MSDKTMRLSVKNWANYNPRKDVKHPTWFRLAHDLFEDPSFYDFTHQELLSWIYILCLCSRANKAQIVVNFRHLEVVGRIKKSEFLKSVEKLEALQIVRVDVTDTLRARYVHVTHACATDRQTNERDETNGQTDVSSALQAAAEAASAIAPALEGEYSPKARELLGTVRIELQESWLSTYPAPDWVREQVNRAATWILANQRKAPKKFAPFMSNWLGRGWEAYRKGLPSERPADEPEWIRKRKALEQKQETKT